MTCISLVFLGFFKQSTEKIHVTFDFDLGLKSMLQFRTPKILQETRVTGTVG